MTEKIGQALCQSLAESLKKTFGELPGRVFSFPEGREQAASFILFLQHEAEAEHASGIGVISMFAENGAQYGFRSIMFAYDEMTEAETYESRNVPRLQEENSFVNSARFSHTAFVAPCVGDIEQSRKPYIVKHFHGETRS